MTRESPKQPLLRNDRRARLLRVVECLSMSSRVCKTEDDEDDKPWNPLYCGTGTSQSQYRLIRCQDNQQNSVRLSQRSEDDTQNSCGQKSTYLHSAAVQTQTTLPDRQSYCSRKEIPGRRISPQIISIKIFLLQNPLLATTSGLNKLGVSRTTHERKTIKEEHHAQKGYHLKKAIKAQWPWFPERATPHAIPSTQELPPPTALNGVGT